MSVLAATRFNRLQRIMSHVTSSSVIVNKTKCYCSMTKQVDVYEGRMSYIDTGGNFDNTVLFLHGNPTSSYLWRNIIPHVSGIARCLAPDLIGMGKSSKVEGMKYTFDDHFKYLTKWMETIDLPQKVNLVIHDWGSGLGFHWANLNQDRVQSITHMESLVGPIPSWGDFPGLAQNIFKAMRSPAGEELVLEKNFFVEQLLPRSVMRNLEDKEKEVYFRPYLNAGEDRRPTLTWPREIPISSDGPSNVVAYAASYNRFLSTSEELPKLFINADPGFFSDRIRETVRDWPNQRTVTVKGLHFLQEDSPNDIGKEIHNFLTKSVF